MPDLLEKAILTNLLHDCDSKRYDVLKLVCMGQLATYNCVKGLASATNLAQRMGHDIIGTTKYETTTAKDTQGEWVTMSCIVFEVCLG